MGAEDSVTQGVSQTGKGTNNETGRVTSTDRESKSQVSRTDRETASKVTQASQTEKERDVTEIPRSTNSLMAKTEVRKQRHKYGLCGLPEEPGVKLTRAPGPQRIRTTQATPNEQMMLRAILARCFENDAVAGKRVLFKPKEVFEVCELVRPYLASEPMCIEDVPFGITIVGDLHGQLHDLARVFVAHAQDGKPGYECAKFIFLGDYVDRGRQSLELVMVLFILKILYPDNFFLLRGNHEFTVINLKNGFAHEIKERYKKGKTARKVYITINETFCWLSISAIVGNIYFCVHGGISPTGFTRSNLRALRKPVTQSNTDILIHDMVWSDPAIGLRGTVFNTTRHTSIFYGMDALMQALASVECLAMFRGHEMQIDGYDNQLWICHTVFSATGQYDEDNDGAFVKIDAHGAMTVHILVVDKERAARDRRLFGKADGEAKTVCENATGKVTTFEENGSEKVKVTAFNA